MQKTQKNFIKNLIQKYGWGAISLVGVTIITTTIAIVMGVLAVQHAMKIRMGFSVSPTIICALYINGEKVFDNKSNEICDGVTLDGATLNFNPAQNEALVGVASDIGYNFTLAIHNYTDTGAKIMTSFVGASISGDTAYKEIIATNTTSTELSVSVANSMTIKMTKVAQVTLNLEGVEYSSGLTEIAEKYYTPLNQKMDANFTLAQGYQNPKFTVSVAGNTIYQNATLANNLVSLTANQVAGDITIATTAEKSGYTIIFNANGGSGSMANVTAGSGESVTLSNSFTKDGVTFFAWNTQADGKGKHYDKDAVLVVESSNLGQTLTLYAIWAYNLTMTYTGSVSGFTNQYLAYPIIVITNDDSFLIGQIDTQEQFAGTEACYSSKNVGDSSSFQYRTNPISSNTIYQNSGNYYYEQSLSDFTGTFEAKIPQGFYFHLFFNFSCLEAADYTWGSFVLGSDSSLPEGRKLYDGGVDNGSGRYCGFYFEMPQASQSATLNYASHGIFAPI